MTSVFQPPPTWAPPLIESAPGTPTYNPVWIKWFVDLVQKLQATAPAGLDVTITTAPLTSGGTAGSLTFTAGVLTAQTPAT